MSGVAIAIGAGAVLGAGATIYGANKQASASRDANAANTAAQQEAERQNWLKYLLQRGIVAPADTQAGVVPSTGQAVNTKMPLWASVNKSGPRRLVLGSPAPVAPQLAIGTGVTQGNNYKPLT